MIRVLCRGCRASMTFLDPSWEGVKNVPNCFNCAYDMFQRPTVCGPDVMTKKEYIERWMELNGEATGQNEDLLLSTLGVIPACHCNLCHRG